MQAHTANMINAIILIVVNTWSYYNATITGLHTLVLLFLGIVLLAMNNGILYHSKGQTIFAIITTLLTVFIIIHALMKSYFESDKESLIYLTLMAFVSVVSSIYLAKAIFSKLLKK
jgi:hypothetical protein